MRLHRFYIEQPLGEELVVVEKELLHQWISVFRYESGDEVILFSSKQLGVDYIYRITSSDKKQVSLSLVSTEKNIFPNKRVTLCMALVKKDTFENVVRYATELGVAKIVPILAERSEKKNLNMERLHIIAQEASEQCGRGDVPAISGIMKYDEAFQVLSGKHVFTSLYGESFKNIEEGDKTELCLWIGPEGGWTKEEESMAADQGASMIKLTDMVLRADTAAITAISQIMLA